MIAPLHLHFTLNALKLWDTIPDEAKERILNNVFCVQCRTSVLIGDDFKGTAVKGSLRLVCSCSQCGHKLVRVI